MERKTEYKKHIKESKKSKKALKKAKKYMQSEKEAKKAEKTKNKGKMYLKMIKRFIEVANEEGTFHSWPKLELQERMTAFTHYELQWEKIKTKALSNKNLPHEVKRFFSEADAHVKILSESLKANMNERMKMLEAPVGDQNNRNDWQLTEPPAQDLPFIQEIPSVEKFSGYYCDWHKFCDAFSQIYECEFLADGEKLAMLKEVLPSDANDFIDGVQDFKASWNMIRQKYANVSNQVLETSKKMENLSIPHISFNGDSDAIVAVMKSIQNIIDSFDKLMQSNPSVYLSSAIINQMDIGASLNWQTFIEKKLNKKDERQSGEYIPNWVDTKAFLKHIIEAAVDKVESMPTSDNDIKSMVLTEDRSKGQIPDFLDCKLCGQVHPLYKCNLFKAFYLWKKLKHVQENALCKRCLRKRHSGDCTNPKCNLPCPQCMPLRKFHNSTLCPKQEYNRHTANQ